jgi:hypothetical protein
VAHGQRERDRGGVDHKWYVGHEGLGVDGYRGLRAHTFRSRSKECRECRAGSACAPSAGGAVDGAVVGLCDTARESGGDC